MFAFKKSLKEQASLVSMLKKTLIINEVFEDKKYSVTSTARTDLWGTSNGMFRVFRAENDLVSNA